MSDINRLEAICEQFREGLINQKELSNFIREMDSVEIADDVANLSDSCANDTTGAIKSTHEHYALMLAVIESMFADIEMRMTGGPVVKAHRDLLNLYDATSDEGVRKSLSAMLSLSAGIRERVSNNKEVMEDHLRTIRQRDKQAQRQLRVMQGMNTELVACDTEKRHLNFMVDKLLGKGGGGVMVCKNSAFEKDE